MKRRLIASLLVFILLLVLACTMSLPTPTPIPSPTGEALIVDHVIDGDTIELSDGEKVRYIGINTPEHGQPYYEEAREANQQLVEGKAVSLELDVVTIDKYGRTLAYVFVGDTFVNLELVRQGFANTYTLPPNVKYAEEFVAAEREAREAGRGLWGRVESGVRITSLNADAPGRDKENLNGEWVEFVNEGDEAVNLKGYTLKDEANHIYTFPHFSLAPRAKVRLYTGSGPDGAGSLYWGMTDPVWNNDGDTAFLRDAEGNLVDSYGY